MKGKAMGAGGMVVAIVGLTTLLCCGANVAVVLMDTPASPSPVESAPKAALPEVADPDSELEPMRRHLDECVQALERDDFEGSKKAWHDAQRVVVGFGGDMSVEHGVLDALTAEVGLIDCRGGGTMESGKKLDTVRCDTELQAVVDSLPMVSEEHHLAPFVASSRKRIASVQAALGPAVEHQKQEAAEAAALVAKCGPEPVPSSWDASVEPAVRYMKARATVAPDSINVQCTGAVMTPTACWMLNCRVTGKNAFGVEVVEPHHFYIGAGSSPLSADRVKAMR